MKQPGEFAQDKDALFGLFSALLLSLEKRGVLKQADFIEDLGKVITLAEREKVLRPSTLFEMTRAQAWLKSQQARLD